MSGEDVSLFVCGVTTASAINGQSMRMYDGGPLLISLRDCLYLVNLIVASHYQCNYIGNYIADILISAYACIY